MKQLSSDDPNTREMATRELQSLGPSIASFLEKKATETSDAEVLYRIECILHYYRCWQRAESLIEDLGLHIDNLESFGLRPAELLQSGRVWDSRGLWEETFPAGVDFCVGVMQSAQAPQAQKIAATRLLVDVSEGMSARIVEVLGSAQPPNGDVAGLWWSILYHHAKLLSNSSFAREAADKAISNVSETYRRITIGILARGGCRQILGEVLAEARALNNLKDANYCWYVVGWIEKLAIFGDNQAAEMLTLISETDCWEINLRIRAICAAARIQPRDTTIQHLAKHLTTLANCGEMPNCTLLNTLSELTGHPWNELAANWRWDAKQLAVEVEKWWRENRTRSWYEVALETLDRSDELAQATPRIGGFEGWHIRERMCSIIRTVVTDKEVSYDPSATEAKRKEAILELRDWFTKSWRDDMLYKTE